tara:strand:+ start:1824 stop:2519 length:696 start_codon:yes stop_codon:yes gene_type:complete
MVMKKCTQCKQGKDINSFHNCKYAKDRHKSECKKCSGKRVLEYYKRTGYRYKAERKNVAETNICCDCKIIKNSSEFHKCSYSKSGLKYMCKDCTRNKYNQHARKGIKCKECDKVITRKFSTVFCSKNCKLMEQAKRLHPKTQYNLNEIEKKNSIRLQNCEGCDFEMTIKINSYTKKYCNYCLEKRLINRELVRNSSLTYDEIPKELIEAKMLELQIKKIIKGEEDGQNKGL